MDASNNSRGERYAAHTSRGSEEREEETPDIDNILGNIPKMAVAKEKPPSAEEILEGAVAELETEEHTPGTDLAVAAAERDAARDAVFAKRGVILRHLANVNEDISSLSPYWSLTTSTSASPTVLPTTRTVVAAPTPAITDQLPPATMPTAPDITTAPLPSLYNIYGIHIESLGWRRLVTAL